VPASAQAPGAGHRRQLPTITREPPVRPRSRRRRHGIAAALVAAYALAAALSVLVRGLLPVPTWLALHLLLLGAASTAVLVWSRHFAQALLHSRPDSERLAAVRLALLNSGVLGVLVGVAAGHPLLAVAGAAVVVAAVAGHVASLVTMLRRTRTAGLLRDAVWYYVASGCALLVGAVLGAVLASGAVGEAGTGSTDGRTFIALHAAHVHANLLGWVGLAVLGTLYMLWPAVLRTRMSEDAPRVARQALAATVPGLAIAVVALLASNARIAAAGVALYAVGAALSLRPFLQVARRRVPSTGAAWLLAAATGWLLAALVVDIAGLLAGRIDQTVDRIVPMLVAGVVVQVLSGALTFLLPVTLGGGPHGNRRLTALLEWAWQVRVVVGNSGVLLVSLPLRDRWAHAGWGLVLAGFGSFVPLVVVALLRTLRSSSPDRAARITP
jgi:nitrite reductase (NO-forming)